MRNRILTALLLAGASTALAWLLHLSNPLQALEAHTLDWRFLFRGPEGEPSKEIVLVLVEDAADLDYRSPIPRRHLAQALDHLSQARLIGLDVILDELSFDSDGDELLRQTLSRLGNVIAVSYLDDGSESMPHQLFREALLDVGYATFSTGTDVEIVRRGTLVRDTDAGRALSLAASLYARVIGADAEAIRRGDAGLLSESLDNSESLLINFSAPPNAVNRGRENSLPGGFTVCPSHLVAAGVYPPLFFRDKIVLVGSGMSDAPDRFRTPFFAGAYGYEKMLGVELHAHYLQTLIGGELLQPTGASLALLMGLLLSLAVSGSVLYADVIKSAAVVTVLTLGMWMVGFALFSSADLVLPLLFPSLAMAIGYGATTAYHALTEGREKRHTRELFERYLAPDVVEEFMQDRSYWELGGKTMEITVMFADLEGFTPLSEQLTPEELVQLINRYLTEMSQIVLDEDGTIDKYEGDLIMAFFGAPIPSQDHAAQACRAALKMQARMEELRTQWKAEELPELKVRIGLHSGPAVVGNMGSDMRFNYTVMGDTVNLASRLEGANKEFGTYTLVSKATKELAQSGGLCFRALGEATVKGKSEAVEVFEPEAGEHDKPRTGA